MGLIGLGQITLTDLTDVRSADLFLKSSLSKIQKFDSTSMIYEPDYSVGNGQVITPLLYFGNELFNFSEGELSYISYQIGDNIILSTKQNGVITEGNYSINENYELVIKENISSFKSLQIFCTIHGVKRFNAEYGDITNSIELVKVNNDSNYNLFLEADRNFFSDNMTTPITVTAKLFRGAEHINSSDNTENMSIYYYWLSSDSATEILGNGKELIIEKDNVSGTETFTCYILFTQIDEDENLITQIKARGLSASITITDQTDPLSVEITSNVLSIFKETTESITLNTMLFQNNSLITPSDSKYSWSYYLESGSNSNSFEILKSNENNTDGSEKEISTSSIILDFSINSEGGDNYVKASQIKAIAEKLPKTGSLIIQCEVETNGMRTINQTKIPIVPDFILTLSPQTVFIPVTSDGYLDSEGEYTQKIDFSLKAPNGSKIVFNKNNSGRDKEPTIEESILPISIKIEQQAKEEGETESFWDDFSINLSISPKSDLKDLSDSILLPIEYTFYGVKYSEELYLIKNKKGQTGEPGKEGGDSENLIKRSRHLEFEGINESIFEVGEDSKQLENEDFWVNKDGEIVTGIDFSYLTNKHREGLESEGLEASFSSPLIEYNDKVEEKGLVLTYELINIEDKEKEDMLFENVPYLTGLTSKAGADNIINNIMKQLATEVGGESFEDAMLETPTTFFQTIFLASTSTKEGYNFFDKTSFESFIRSFITQKVGKILSDTFLQEDTYISVNINCNEYFEYYETEFSNSDSYRDNYIDALTMEIQKLYDPGKLYRTIELCLRKKYEEKKVTEIKDEETTDEEINLINEEPKENDIYGENLEEQVIGTFYIVGNQIGLSENDSFFLKTDWIEDSKQTHKISFNFNDNYIYSEYYFFIRMSNKDPDWLNNGVLDWSDGKDLPKKVAFRKFKLEYGDQPTIWTESEKDFSISKDYLIENFNKINNNLFGNKMEIEELINSHEVLDGKIAAQKETSDKLKETLDGLESTVNKYDAGINFVPVYENDDNSKPVIGEKIVIHSIKYKNDGSGSFEKESDNRMELNEKELSFFSDNKKVAYFSNKKLSVEGAELTNFTSIGEKEQGFLHFQLTDLGVAVSWRYDDPYLIVQLLYDEKEKDILPKVYTHSAPFSNNIDFSKGHNFLPPKEIMSALNLIGLQINSFPLVFNENNIKNHRLKYDGKNCYYIEDLILTEEGLPKSGFLPVTYLKNGVIETSDPNLSVNLPVSFSLEGTPLENYKVTYCIPDDVDPKSIFEANTGTYQILDIKDGASDVVIVNNTLEFPDLEYIQI